MGRSRYYTDEHVSRAVIAGLRQRGVDVLSVPEANQLGASDLEHLAFAFAEGQVLFTHDDDFLRLAAAGVRHAGMVHAHQRTSVGEMVQGGSRDSGGGPCLKGGRRDASRPARSSSQRGMMYAIF